MILKNIVKEKKMKRLQTKKFQQSQNLIADTAIYLPWRLFELKNTLMDIFSEEVLKICSYFLDNLSVAVAHLVGNGYNDFLKTRSIKII